VASSIVLIAVCGILSLLVLAQFICFVMVVIKMFQHDQSGLGIACIVLALCTGLGGILAFIMGWVKAGEWHIKGLMMAWTGLVVVGMLFGMIAGIATLFLGQPATSTFSTVGASIGGS
jgi:hypothetical protein